MQRMAGSFYGRLGAYTAALGARDKGALAAAIGRNVLGAETHVFAPALAALALAVAERQSRASVESLFAADGWSAPEQ
jgi:hypothetical protein